ncbi:hypothetical protein ROJ8625_01644 [Roseivivax jejudonensis]|uniref:Uncharacterized protein n=1 Tax=Roseivivax jejudonensis TaxID=1529041 RepID=A0A1X6YZS4_9RHOB|nr:hypothetical protein [Roseivivax jejudonensis]SLN36519.1 hypothetical protein ROJ8625_01644 [Roseivivax jejudonensis]
MQDSGDDHAMLETLRDLERYCALHGLDDQRREFERLRFLFEAMLTEAETR